MKHTKQLHNLVSSATALMTYEEEDKCPICKSKISPVYIASALNTLQTATVFNHCCSCQNGFISNYRLTESPSSTTTHLKFNSELTSSEPLRFTKEEFDANIIELSPQFDKIYNQALAAESSGLDEIAGLGYRKSLEFLIKDFAIHQNPNDTEKIKQLMLSPCIKKYISNEQIQTLAERSTWIGNDEAHYIRKQEDRDVSDMKKFIKATVYFIGMILITEDAESMTPAK